MSGASYATREPVKSVPWHRLVVWDMFANGLTTGLFLVAVLCEFMSPDEFGAVARFAYPLALLFLTVDLVLLVLDLGDPWRFHHMLRVFKPSSPMSLGVWSLTAYSFPLGVAAVFGFLPMGSVVETVRWTALVLGIVPAFLSAVYKGVLLSTSSQPGWRDARWLGAYHTTGAIVLGAAEMIVLALVMGRPEAATSLQHMLMVDARGPSGPGGASDAGIATGSSSRTRGDDAATRGGRAVRRRDVAGGDSRDPGLSGAGRGDPGFRGELCREVAARAAAAPGSLMPLARCDRTCSAGMGG